MSVTDNILKTIDYAIDKKTKHLLNMDVMGIISSINNDGTYEVKIDDAVYQRVPNGSGIGYKKGDSVWVHSPNGDFNKKFIISSRASNSGKLFNNSGEGSHGGGGSINPDDIITNAEIRAMFRR